MAGIITPRVGAGGGGGGEGGRGISKKEPKVIHVLLLCATRLAGREGTNEEGFDQGGTYSESSDAEGGKESEDTRGLWPLPRARKFTKWISKTQFVAMVWWLGTRRARWTFKG